MDRLIAERIDARKMAFRYRYDAQRRLASIEVGHYPPTSTAYAPSEFVSGYPATLTGLTAAQDDRVGFVEYTYDRAGRPADTIARRKRYQTGTTPGEIVAHNRAVHDLRGNLYAEFQSHEPGVLIPPYVQIDFDISGTVDPDDLSTFLACYFEDPPCPETDIDGDGDVTPDDLSTYIAVYFDTPDDTPFVGYGWSRENTSAASIDAAGHNRLVSMRLPVHTDVTMDGRAVVFGYGATGSADAAGSRVASITTAPSDLASGSVAAFAYAGVHRRATMWLGLDGSTAAVTQTLAGSGVGLGGLDRFGRLADLHYRNHYGSTGETLFRARYVYDRGGNRLGAEVQQAPTTGQSAGAFDNKRSQFNIYDRLDRLVGMQLGELQYSSGLPASVTSMLRDEAWRMDLLGNWVGGGTSSLPGRSATGTLGGLGALGSGAASVTYAVDGRNAMAQLLARDGSGQALTGMPVTPRQDDSGSLTYDGTHFYQYDAWGRVVQVNQASVAGGSPGGPTDTLTVGALVKHFTYDGVGRLIAVRSPRPGPSGSNTSGSNVPVRDEHLYYDGIRRVQEVVHDFSTPDGNGDRELQVALLTREYIWGPGDGPAGVDEMLAMFDGEAQGKPWWVLQDAGGDIVALCESPQPGGPGTSLSPARVAGQWVYDAYGAALTAETLYPHPELHGGHKGLFFDRLDGDVAALSAAGADETPRLEPAATLLVYMRNRSYLPHQGRFLQMDPNQTAMVVLAMASSGGSLRGYASPIDLLGRFGDGAHLYGYLRSNPGIAFDPSGTMSLGEAIGSMGVQGMLYGALFGGVMGGIQGALDPSVGFWQGAGRGALIGGFSGGVGGAVAGAGMWPTQGVMAFGASGAGLYASLVMRGTAIGGVAGMAGGGAASAYSQYLDERPVNWREVVADAAFAGYLGMALGGGFGAADSGARFLAGAFRASPTGPYAGMADLQGVWIDVGRDFTRAQRDALLLANRARNGGALRCDVTREELRPSAGYPNSAEIDHIHPASLGGNNSFGNARVVSRTFNRSRGNGE